MELFMKTTGIILSWILVIFIFDSKLANADDFEGNFLRWANELEKSLVELQPFTGYDYLKSAYSSTKFTKQELDEQAAFAFLDKAIEKINAIVKQKAAIVDNIKEAAEKAFVARPDSPPEGCYVRAKAISLQPVPAEGNDTSNCTRKFYLPMEYNTQFENKYISMNESVAHVPTNVYDLSEELLTVANWTDALNSVFQQNAANDPTLRWQYFGSSTGFFKYYPGAMWNIQLDEPFLDFFDCRSQPWYLSASAYPKEMIIMVDKSGSMKGRNDIISNATVAEILNTLTENDYFNILMFSDVPKYADPAIDGGLLRATKFNKDHFIQKFKDFAPNGTASYERGLIEAFLLFNKSEKFYPNFHHCNRNIMIITDGAPASFGEIFDKYNPDKEVRVFAYLLGQHSSAEPYIEEMACNNRGYAVNIATLADVKENVLKYLDVVARSNVLLDDSYTIWTSATVSQFNLKELNERNFTNPYVVRYSELPTLPGIYPPVVFETPEIKIDTMIASREEEPVLYTSVARAVFDRSKKAAKLKQGNLLGVAGTDVPLQYFKDALRGWEIGPNNYLFAVDNNGFVLFHPAFRPVYKATLKSYYQNVDLNEIEIPEDVKVNPWSATPDYNTSLRQSVVDRERKVNEMRTYLITDNYHTMFQGTIKYFTDAIENTPFTLGLGIHWNPATGKSHPIPAYKIAENVLSSTLTTKDMSVFASVYGGDSINCSALHNQTVDGAFLSPYEFCQFDKNLAADYLVNPICALRKVLLDKSLQKSLSCNQEFLDRIYMEAKQTQGIHEHWRSQRTDKLVDHWGIQQAFVFHQSGLIRYYNYTAQAYPNFITDHMYGVEDAMYSETVLTTKYFSNQRIAVFHTPPNDLFRQFTGEQLPVPTLVTMTVPGESEDVPMAVAGIQITHRNLQRLFNQVTEHCTTKDCKPCSDREMNCYIINQAALILVSSNGDKEVGKNLKEVNCALVEDLVNQSALTETFVFDFQGICIELREQVRNFSSRLLAPFYYLVRIVSKLIWEFTLFAIGLLEPLYPLPTKGQKWGLYAETDTKPPAETREPYTLYDTLEKPGIEGDAGRRYYGYDTGYDPRYKEDERQPYGYHAQQYSPQHELKGPHGNPSEGLDKVDPSVQLPTLPPLKSEADVLGENGESNSSTSTPTTTEEPEPELSEVPLDEFYSKIEEDPYEAQLRALAAIESCRREQSIQIQSHFEPDLEFNETEVEEDNETTSSTVTPSSVKSGKTTPSNKLIPGSLLACVYRSVQQRCHVGSATSSFTSRYACEAVCEVVRDRMPQVANKLEDCRQPLVSCTERFVVFSVATSWPVEKSEPHADNLDSYPSKPNPQSRKPQTPTAYTASGEYCQECGKKRWWLKPLIGTNLFLLVDQNLPGSTTGSCRCRCQKRFRYGARIATDPSKPKPIRSRRNPPFPATCGIVKAAMENSSTCTDGEITTKISLHLMTCAAILQTYILLL